MKQFSLISLVVFILTIGFSCQKESESDSVLPLGKEYISSASNSFFPFDTNKVWIYDKEQVIYDDVEDETLNTNINDTLSFSQEILKDKYLARKFGDHYFYTTESSIAILLDTTLYRKDFTVFTIAFTNTLDTTWQQTVNDSRGNTLLTITQTVLEDDELQIDVSNGLFLPLYNSYVFKRNVGLIKKELSSLNTETFYSLVKTE